MSKYLSQDDLDRLKALKEAPGDEWCRPSWAVSLLKALRLDNDAIDFNWVKLAGRRCADVRRLDQEMRRARPEQWQAMLTSFAKNHQSVKGGGGVNDYLTATHEPYDRQLHLTNTCAHKGMQALEAFLSISELEVTPESGDELRRAYRGIQAAYAAYARAKREAEEAA